MTAAGEKNEFVNFVERCLRSAVVGELEGRM
jgi:hypothetical protein